MNYYNEIDLYAAEWLRNLIDAGHIAPGVVDTRSIEDVRPEDLAGFTQCHFFAGLGGWALALELAGWPRDRPVWTGSCPCQPFSAAGKGAGFADERHLWPAWQHLIAQCNPSDVLGEQVASKAVDAWIDLVHADLEGMGYAFGSIPFPAAGIGAPHIRDRNYWMAHTNGKRFHGKQVHLQPGAARFDHTEASKGRGLVELADAASLGWVGRWAGEASYESSQVERLNGFRHALWLADSQRVGIRSDGSGADEGTSPGVQGEDGQRERFWSDNRSGRTPLLDGLGDAERDGLRSGRRTTADLFDESGYRSVHADASRGTGPTNGSWGVADWLRCTDGKWRPVEPGTFPLAHGVSGSLGRVRADQERLTAQVSRKDQGSRTGRLKAYGNAIVPQQAAHFIEAMCEARGIRFDVMEQVA